MLRVLHSNPIIFPVLTLQETNCGFTVYIPINAQSSPYTKISLHLPLSWALIKLCETQTVGCVFRLLVSSDLYTEPHPEAFSSMGVALEAVGAFSGFYGPGRECVLIILFKALSTFLKFEGQVTCWKEIVI